MYTSINNMSLIYSDLKNAAIFMRHTNRKQNRIDPKKKKTENKIEQFSTMLDNIMPSRITFRKQNKK